MQKLFFALLIAIGSCASCYAQDLAPNYPHTREHRNNIVRQQYNEQQELQRLNAQLAVLQNRYQHDTHIWMASVRERRMYNDGIAIQRYQAAIAHSHKHMADMAAWLRND